MSETYMIVRFFQEEGKPAKVMKRGLDLEQAQKHCKDPHTKGKVWFDGYTKEGRR